MRGRKALEIRAPRHLTGHCEAVKQDKWRTIPDVAVEEVEAFHRDGTHLGARLSVRRRDDRGALYKADA